MTTQPLRKALLDLKEKRIAQKEADKNKKAYFNAPVAVSLSDAKKSADAAEKEAKKVVYDIAADMVRAKIPLDYGVQKKKVSAKKEIVYDDEAATAWCLENAKAALTVNRAVLDSILASKSTLPDFAEKKITPEGFTITIPTNLNDLE